MAHLNLLRRFPTPLDSFTYLGTALVFMVAGGLNTSQSPYRDNLYRIFHKMLSE